MSPNGVMTRPFIKCTELNVGDMATTDPEKGSAPMEYIS